MSRESTLDLLGDATRRRILDLLREQPRSVGAVAERLPVSRPAVSKHLRLLKDAGLVAVEVAGTRRIYRVEPEGFAPVVEYWGRFWDDVLAAFKEYAESEGEGDRP